ncbi:MAG: ribonuclease HI [Gammaproteobacteria bacterium]|nr:ribonuclease HI [Gammaproteobacteria bacterium]MCH9744778.1 ribonuclease HI [Gammaproteobacteria bacterium]
MKHKVEMFTDGACRGNPGPGGWGVLLRCDGKEKQLYGAESETTNNRMELLAVIEGLRALKNPCVVSITTDSQYVLKGVTEWMQGWKTKGWRTSSKKPVKNVDLWQQLDELIVHYDIEWHWVRGHTGHPENEIADGLANRAIDEWLHS